MSGTSEEKSLFEGVATCSHTRVGDAAVAAVAVSKPCVLAEDRAIFAVDAAEAEAVFREQHGSQLQAAREHGKVQVFVRPFCPV